MTTQSLFADVLDAIYDTLAADATLAALVAAETLLISDGPPAGARDRLQEVWVGALDDVLGDQFESTTNVSQVWATAGGPSVAERDEVIDVPCCVWVWRGDTDMRTCRRTAQTLLDAACTALRGQTLGVPQLMWAELLSGQFGQVQTDDGAAVVMVFTIRVQTRL